VIRELETESCERQTPIFSLGASPNRYERTAPDQLVDENAATQIFLSYAHADKDQVGGIYGALSNEGYKPWMDVRDILPGEDWALAIRRAIRGSDFFLAFLSQNSVNRRGWIQKEIKVALDYREEKLVDDIWADEQ
jgi:TIR domain